MNHLSCAALIASVSLSTCVFAQEIPGSEYRARRERLLGRFGEGIVLLHARSTEAGLDSHQFKQDASFLYFTGLSSQPAAILALDGPKREAILFVPPAPQSFGLPVEGVSLAPGAPSAREQGLDRVLPFAEFRPWLEARLAAGAVTLYLDESRRPVMPGNPDDLWPMAGAATLFRRALEEAFPGAKIASAEGAIREMRWVKSPYEIAILREVARATASALGDGIRAVHTGARQRETEAAVVSGCIAAGAEGPAFWPWTMSGPNARLSALVRTMYDYHHLDRVMRAGEVVRMDVGCDLGLYEGDVGRTVPVSGAFTSEQAEAWDLLIAAYRAGLAALRSGLTHAELARIARGAVAAREPSLRTEYARKAAKAMLEAGDDLWHVHGVGIEGGEERLDRLEAGSVIAFEPMVEVDGDAFYLEDMILVTDGGHEVLSQGLPYTSDEIARSMASR
jgi:Xaa-Pro aminopeptidase